MKKSIYIILALLLPLIMFSQDGEEKESKFLKKFYEENKPIRPAFETGQIIDGQTVQIPTAKTLEMVIQHRFGPMDNGIKDLWGIYGPGANTRMGLNFSVTDWLMVGWGIMKYHMVNDFSVKINLMRQTRNNKSPLDIVLFGNMTIDGQADKNYGKNYSFGNRFGYFSQLLVSRKFNHWFSLQVGGSFTHFNSAEQGYEHDKIGVHFLGRFKISPQSSVAFSYDWPLVIGQIAENIPMKDPSKPNFGITYEVSTSTHDFQIFVTTSGLTDPAYIMMHNQSDWTNGDLIFGFNITRLWSF